MVDLVDMMNMVGIVLFLFIDLLKYIIFAELILIFAFIISLLMFIVTYLHCQIIVSVSLLLTMMVTIVVNTDIIVAVVVAISLLFFCGPVRIEPNRLELLFHHFI